jgi:hypothetical protein
MTNKAKVLKVEQLTITIPIQALCYSGSWIRVIANTKIELRHVQDGIILLVNDVLQPVRWQVYERAIKGNIGYRGGYIPHDRAWVYYLIGSNGRRHRCLYLRELPEDNFRIGTRKDHGAVYTSSCYSHRQRKIPQECCMLLLTKRQRERQERLTATEK